MKKLLSKISLVFFFFGVDLMRIYSFRFFIRFLRDRSRFKKLGGKISHIMPEFGDFSEATGKAKGHYFHQDLFVSSLIRKVANNMKEVKNPITENPITNPMTKPLA